MNNMEAKTDRVVAFAILLVWTAIVTFRYWNDWSIDMSAIFMAGHFAAEGQHHLIFGEVEHLFAKDLPDEWGQTLNAFGFPAYDPIHFVYPPIWAYLVAPLAGLTEPMQFFNLTRPFVIASFAGSVVLAWRIMKPTGVTLTLWSLIAIVVAETTAPWTVAVDLNQPQLIIIFLLLLAFERYMAGKDITAGAILGLVAAIKITPILLCAIFLFDRRYRAIIAAGFVSGGIGLLSLLVAGWDMHMVFLARVSQIELLVPLVGLNFTFETVMNDFVVAFIQCEYCANRLQGMNVEWVAMLSNLIMPGALFATLWFTRRMTFEDRTKLRLLLVPLVTMFFSPLAWMHYYTLPVLLFPGLVSLYPMRAVLYAGLPFWAGFSLILMETRLDSAIANQNWQAFYPQHTALLSLVALVALIAFSKRWAVQEDGTQAVSA